MKIYILSDMEGISGIRFMEAVDSKSSGYQEACKLMMADVNAAINGAFQGGAKEVVVCDTHGGGGQLQLDKMDPRAYYETPSYKKVMPSLDSSFDGLIQLGRHAQAGTINGFLDHTMSPAEWFCLKLNNKTIGEIGVAATHAGHFNVPTIMVEGDHAAVIESQKEFGKIEVATVKWGLGRNRAKCLSCVKAHDLILKTAKKSVESAKTFKPYKPRLPAVGRLTLYRSDMADSLACKPYIKRIDARTVEWKIKAFDKFFPWW